MPRLSGLTATIAASTVLVGCAHVTNVALCTDGESRPAENCDFSPEPQSAYRFDPKKADRDTLVVVTFSGGGIRASALAYGTLKALDGLPGLQGKTLLDDVDIISSVSGGSATAGWYALKGRAGIDAEGDGKRFQAFLKDDWTSTIAWRGLNPVALGRYVFTPYQR